MEPDETGAVGPVAGFSAGRPGPGILRVPLPLPRGGVAVRRPAPAPLADGAHGGRPAPDPGSDPSPAAGSGAGVAPTRVALVLGSAADGDRVSGRRRTGRRLEDPGGLGLGRQLHPPG